MRYKSRQLRSERLLSCEELEARRCLAVTFSPRQIISDQIDGALSVYAADLDGDGDVDAISASNRDSKIAWYENTDGKGSFGDQIIIARTGGRAVMSVSAADVDGDSDLDVLMVSFATSKIAWYENTDGKGTFGDENVITSRSNGAGAVHAVDVDGDGDVDVLSASGDKIAWYENNDGQGTFGQHPHIISRTAAWDVYATDLDGDGDVDVLPAYGRDGKIAWYENTDGKGTFGDENVITREVIDVRSVQAADVDGDGDMDVLSASYADNKYAWYENTDGMGSFGPQKVITTEAKGARGIYPADLDGDRDVDVLASLFGDDTIAWYENTDGMGNFGPQNVLDEGPEINQPSEVRAADVDGDGDMDVLSASNAGDHIAWYENFSPQIAAGDANRDCQFDQLDIVQVLQAAKYLTEEPAAFEDGDWNGDGLFNQLDIVAALQTGNYLQGPDAAHRDN